MASISTIPSNPEWRRRGNKTDKLKQKLKSKIIRGDSNYTSSHWRQRVNNIWIIPCKFSHRTCVSWTCKWKQRLNIEGDFPMGISPVKYWGTRSPRPIPELTPVCMFHSVILQACLPIKVLQNPLHSCMISLCKGRWDVSLWLLS